MGVATTVITDARGWALIGLEANLQFVLSEGRFDAAAGCAGWTRRGGCDLAEPERGDAVVGNADDRAGGGAPDRLGARRTKAQEDAAARGSGVSRCEAR